MKKPVKNFREWSRSSFNLNESIQFPTDHDEIEQILKILEIENYSIRPDGTVDVNGDVNLEDRRFEYFPVKFGIVKGNFWCSDCDNLKTLEGAPAKCKEFDCSWCINLESLEGAPEKCEEFYCHYCYELKSLKGAPEKCTNFDCCDCNSLKTLEGAPEECEIFYCSGCKNLEYSLEHFPKCKEINIKNTCFKELYNTIGNDNFIELINNSFNFELDNILAIGYSRGLNFEEHIKPLLKDKTMTEEAFKHTYRGAVAGERFRF